MRAPMVAGVVLLAAGIVVGVEGPVAVRDGPFFVGLAAAIAAGAGLLARPGARSRGRPVLGLMFLAGGLLGGVARAEADRSCTAWLPPDVPLAVEGRLVGGVGHRRRVAVDAVELGGLRVPCRVEVAARIDSATDPGSGRILARGRWWRPPGASGPRPSGLLLLESVDARPGPAAGGRSGGGLLTELRSSARRRVDRLWGARSPMAASLLLAQRDDLDRHVRDRFARAGLSHLLAISGLHVALVAGMLMVLAGVFRVGKAAGAVAAGLGTLGYVAFLGAPHSATRAALQILMVLTARAVQRPARPEALMATAALILLVADPLALYEPGFQLSFAGVAGILALRPVLLGRLRRLATLETGRLPVGRWLADGLATSVAATVATAPIVAWHFGRLAPVGVAANLVAIPLLAATVPALAAALAAGLVWLPAGAFLADGGAALMDALDATARLAAGIPGGTVPVAGSVAWVVTGAMVAGALAGRRLGAVRPGVRRAVWVGVAGAVLLVAPLRPAGDGVELHVIDVGQGDAIALRSPAGRWVLVDAGVARPGYDAGARRVVPYLARHGVTRLEGLIVTHPDADHMGGAESVIRALRPRWVADPGMPAGKPGYLQLLRAAADRGVPWYAARRGMEVEVDGVLLEFLSPYAAGAAEDANAVSVVVRAVYGDFEALLTGDAPAAVERQLVRWFGDRLAADVLKVGHHGSTTSTTPELLAATGARLAAISAGRGNRYGHPHRAVLRRLAGAGLTVVRTDRDGSLTIRGTAAGGVSVEAERGRGAGDFPFRDR